MLEFLLENDFISALLAFALVLIPAIIFHELGHFFAAKAIGVNVLEFGIGFPPRAMRLFMWGETEFTLNWLPLGGFVRPLGEDMIGPTIEVEDEYDNEYDTDQEKPKHHYITEREELRNRGIRDEEMLSVNEAKPLPRIFFMFAGPLANFITAIIFFMIVALLGLPEVIGARVQLINIPALSSLAGQVQVGDAVELVDGDYFQSTREFFDKVNSVSTPVTLTIRNPETNERYELIYNNTLGQIENLVFLSAISPNSPAEEAGLKIGDYIVEINDVPFSSASEPVEQIIAQTKANAGQSMTLLIRRGTQEFTVDITPRLDPPPNAGRMGISISSHYQATDGLVFAWAAPQEELIPQTLGNAISHGVNRFFEILTLIVNIPSQIIDGTISPEEARPVSIVGISQVGGQFLQQSIRDNTPGLLLDFLALISIFLGATNLLPLPPLDGGRILFVIIEMVRGKPLSPNIEYNIYRIGMIFFLSLGALIILYDIFNPFVLPS